MNEQMSEETPHVDVTGMLSNAAIVAAMVGAVASIYTLITGKHLTTDQTAALTQLIPYFGLILAGLAVKRGKASAKRADAKQALNTARVVNIVSDHLNKVGETGAAAALQSAVTEVPSK